MKARIATRVVGLGVVSSSVMFAFAVAAAYAKSPDQLLESGVDRLVNNNAGATGTAYFTQSEASIVAFGNTVVVGFNDSGPYQGVTNKFTGFAYSTNGGATFTDGGTLPDNPGGDAGDPTLAMNHTTGRIYFATIGFNNFLIQVFRSDNNGVTWSAAVNGTPGGNSEEKQWLAVDNFLGAGNGNVYLVSRSFGRNGIYFTRSIDGGASFIAPCSSPRRGGLTSMTHLSPWVPITRCTRSGMPTTP